MIVSDLSMMAKRQFGALLHECTKFKLMSGTANVSVKRISVINRVRYRRSEFIISARNTASDGSRRVSISARCIALFISGSRIYVPPTAGMFI